jgi:hypothetical protein
MAPVTHIRRHGRLSFADWYDRVDDLVADDMGAGIRTVGFIPNVLLYEWYAAGIRCRPAARAVIIEACWPPYLRWQDEQWDGGFYVDLAFEPAAYCYIPWWRSTVLK